MSIAKRIAARQEAARSKLEVAEWGEDDNTPLVIYYGPFLAIEMDKIQRKHPKFLSEVTFPGMVDVIVMKAEDADGNKLFSLEDKPILMREQTGIIARVAAALMSSDSVEEQEKN